MAYGPEFYNRESLKRGDLKIMGYKGDPENNPNVYFTQKVVIDENEFEIMGSIIQRDNLMSGRTNTENVGRECLMLGQEMSLKTEGRITTRLIDNKPIYPVITDLIPVDSRDTAMIEKLAKSIFDKQDLKKSEIYLNNKEKGRADTGTVPLIAVNSYKKNHRKAAVYDFHRKSEKYKAVIENKGYVTRNVKFSRPLCSSSDDVKSHAAQTRDAKKPVKGILKNSNRKSL